MKSPFQPRNRNAAVAVNTLVHNSSTFKVLKRLLCDNNRVPDVLNNSTIITCLSKLGRFAPGRSDTLVERIVFLILLAASLGTFALSWEGGILLTVISLSYLCCFLLSRPKIPLSVLIFSLALSPKIILGTLSSQAIPIRIDDILIAFLALFLIREVAINGKKFVSSPLDIPILLYLSIGAIATLRGILIGTIDKPIISLLYLCKRIEYFLIFYLFLNLTASKKEAKLFIRISLVTALCVALYGIWEHLYPLAEVAYPGFYRTYERGLFYGQSNHFGAYLMFLSMLTLALATFCKKLRHKFILFAIMPVLLLALLWTYSRQSYLALFVALLAFSLLIGGRRSIPLFIILGLLLLLLPHTVLERTAQIKEAFLSSDIYHSSMAFRFRQWRMALETFKYYPLLGVGWGARHRAFYESQFVMVLSEIGAIGLMVFLWLLARMFKTSLFTWRTTKEDVLKGLAAGFIVGFLGLVIQGTVLVDFIITRVVGPCWVIIAIMCSDTWRFDESRQKEL